jgi:hypothetical protein
LKAPDPKPRRSTSDRSRIRSAAYLWGTLTLSGVSILGGLTIWHLRRRGRLLRDRLGPPRDVRPLTDEEQS